MRLLWRGTLICLWIGIVVGSVSTSDKSDGLSVKDTKKNEGVSMATRIQRNLIPCISNIRGYGWCDDRLFRVRPQDGLNGAPVYPPQVNSFEYSYPNTNTPYEQSYSNPTSIFADQVLMIVPPAEKVQTSNIPTKNATSPPNEASTLANHSTTSIQPSSDIVPKNETSKPTDVSTNTSDASQTITPNDAEKLSNLINIAKARLYELEERLNANNYLNRRKREVNNEVRNDDSAIKEIMTNVILTKNKMYEVMKGAFDRGPGGDFNFPAFINRADALVRMGREPLEVFKDVISNLFIFASKLIQSENTGRDEHVNFKELYDVLEDIFKSDFSRKSLDAYFEKLAKMRRMRIDPANLGMDVLVDLFLIVEKQKVSKKEKKALASKAVHLLMDSIFRLDFVHIPHYE